MDSIDFFEMSCRIDVLMVLNLNLVVIDFFLNKSALP